MQRLQPEVAAPVAVRTGVRAGRIGSNHSQAGTGPVGVRAAVRTGTAQPHQHSQAMAASIIVRNGVRARSTSCPPPPT
jgi:hypothetical protein